MKSTAKIFTAVIALASLCAFLAHRWWHQPGPGTTFIKLTGMRGDTFTGFYVQYGKRVEVASAVPWQMALTGISEAEFRKSRADEALRLEARHFKERGFDAFVAGPVKPEFAGMRVEVHQSGIAMEPIR